VLRNKPTTIAMSSIRE